MINGKSSFRFQPQCGSRQNAEKWLFQMIGLNQEQDRKRSVVDYVRTIQQLNITDQGRQALCSFNYSFLRVLIQLVNRS